jgi:hypothetical protein
MFKQPCTGSIGVKFWHWRQNGRDSGDLVIFPLQKNEPSCTPRALSHRCTALARGCSDRAVGHELEGLSVELMEKAQELESSGLH